MDALSSDELMIAKQYDSVAKKSLANAVRDYLRETADYISAILPLNEPDAEHMLSMADELATTALDFVSLNFQVMQYTIGIRSELLYDALAELSVRNRDILLMYTWLDMNDREIADEIGLSARRVNDLRNESYKKLKIILEGLGYDAKAFFPGGNK